MSHNLESHPNFVLNFAFVSLDLYSNMHHFMELSYFDSRRQQRLDSKIGGERKGDETSEEGRRNGDGEIGPDSSSSSSSVVRIDGFLLSLLLLPRQAG